ncbi:phosphotransferase KptA/Tpt1 [Backusella circina FSU 941]|nr:phosphotransferase KptA/Tpt1 [Backusella circina FSU 941]
MPESQDNPILSEREGIILSKKLAYFLRHGAVKEKISISDAGYIALKDLLAHKKFKGDTFEHVKYVVDTNPKKRYELTMHDNGEYMIRASQGHSIKSVGEKDLLSLLENEESPVIHGTTREAWSIIKEMGLSKMGRNHIHCAIGLPGDPKVKSGMRKSSEVFIYINVPKAKKDGIVFYISKNGVILTEGSNGIISPVYFEKVIDKKGDALM